jgi:TM2 domain-containing membrane protein YozV
MQSRPATGGFGRKIDPAAAELARKREAFLAAERARCPEPAQPEPRSASPTAPMTARKSMAVAYIFWFALGALSGHRFYLGLVATAIAQSSLWFLGWLLVATGTYVGLLAVLAGAVWVIVDAFLIPGLCRAANPRSGPAPREIFA